MVEIRVAEKIEQNNVLFEVIEWRDLDGLTDPRLITQMYEMKQARYAVRQAKLTVNKTAVILEAGALQYYVGNFDIENKIPAGKVIGRMFGAAMTGETAFRPLYRGSGTIWLEPTFGHLLVLGLQNETFIVDQGMFLCATEGVKVEAKLQSNVSSALFGGEGLFQTMLSGTGAVVLTSPVPEAEIQKYTIRPGEKVVVDGSFALARSGNVKFSVGKSSRSWIGTATTGEGLLQNFEVQSGSEGEVWVAQTVPFYDRLRYALFPPVPPV